MYASEGAQAHTQVASYVTFQLGPDEYAVPVARLQEIAPMDTLTRIPGVAACLRGVMNLRGAVLPVIDLSLRFGFGETSASKRACLLVVHLPVAGDLAAIGLYVDAVRRVVDVAPPDVLPPPSLGLPIAPRFVTGLVKAADRFLVLLDLEKVFAPDELSTLLGDARLAPRHDPPPTEVAPAPSPGPLAAPAAPAPPAPKLSDDELIAAGTGTEIMLFDD